MKTRPFFVLAFLLMVFSSCGKKQTPQFSPGELVQLISLVDSLGAKYSFEPGENYKSIRKSEEADADRYAPAQRSMIFIKSTKDWHGVYPRYWLGIEEYSSAVAAQKRKSEYMDTGRLTGLPVEEGYPDKVSVRLWAEVIGSRVYMLTTDAAVFDGAPLDTALHQKIKDFI